MCELVQEFCPHILQRLSPTRKFTPSCSDAHDPLFCATECSKSHSRNSFSNLRVPCRAPNRAIFAQFPVSSEKTIANCLAPRPQGCIPKTVTAPHIYNMCTLNSPKSTQELRQRGSRVHTHNRHSTSAEATPVSDS
jgi:hypothetical protein